MKLVSVIRYDQVVSEVMWDGKIGYSRTATYTLDEVGVYLHRGITVIPLTNAVQIVSDYTFHTDLNDVEGSAFWSSTHDEFCDSVDPVGLAKESVRDFDFFADEGFEG